MTKTIAQIQNEMNTVKLIKQALDVSGDTAFKLFKEWTTNNVNEPQLTSGTINNATKINVDKNTWGTLGTSTKVQEILDNEFDTAKGIVTGIAETDIFTKAQQSAENFADNVVHALEKYLEFARQGNTN